MEFTKQRRRFSMPTSAVSSNHLESETLRMEKKLAELRTVQRVDQQQARASSKFVWQGGRSGKLRHFKYGKRKKPLQQQQQPEPPQSGRRTTSTRPATPPSTSAGHEIAVSTSPVPITAADLVGEYGMWRPEGERAGPASPPRAPATSSGHEIAISTSPVPITAADLEGEYGMWRPDGDVAATKTASAIHEVAAPSSDMWFPGLALPPKESQPEVHVAEASIGTDGPGHGVGKENAMAAEGPKPQAKQLVQSYFARLYLQQQKNAG